MHQLFSCRWETDQGQVSVRGRRAPPPHWCTLTFLQELKDFTSCPFWQERIDPARHSMTLRALNKVNTVTCNTYISTEYSWTHPESGDIPETHTGTETQILLLLNYTPQHTL